MTHIRSMWLAGEGGPQEQHEGGEAAREAERGRYDDTDAYAVGFS